MPIGGWSGPGSLRTESRADGGNARENGGQRLTGESCGETKRERPRLRAIVRGAFSVAFPGLLWRVARDISRRGAGVKAIRVHEFGGPEVLKLEEVPDLQPGPGQVLVRVHAAGVNPVENYIRTGTYAIKPALPYTPGADAAGVVAAVGAGVNSVKRGDRVYTSGSLSGTYAEQTLCSEAQVHPLPANVSFEQGAAMGVAYGTAYRGAVSARRRQTQRDGVDPRR